MSDICSLSDSTPLPSPPSNFLKLDVCSFFERISPPWMFFIENCRLFKEEYFAKFQVKSVLDETEV